MTRNVLCVLCGTCVKACPNAAISISEGTRVVDWKACTGCLACARACPNGAIVVSGQAVTAEEVVEEVAKDVVFFKTSGGGITLSGGEPLSHPQFAARLFALAKAKGLHTALETTGCVPWKAMETVLKDVDLVLFDVKSVDAKAHRRGTGVPNELILANLERTVRRSKTWVRIPVIPGFNDTDADIQGIAELVRTLTVEKVSLLPYHGWGQAKYEQLGRQYALTGIEPPSKERMEQLCKVVTDAGLACTISY